MYRICKYSKFLLLLLLFSSHTNFRAQTGNYFVQNFLPKTYQSAANNFGVTQNDAGLIFVANDNGVLIYDGINWSICQRFDQVSIKCVAKTSSGEIVAGADDGDIAIIQKDKRGIYHYQSLFNSLTRKNQGSDVIRQIISLGKSTFFLSSDKLIEYSDSGLKFFNPIEKFHARAWAIGQHLFVTELDHHLSVLMNGRLQPILGTEELAKEKSFFCYPLSESRYALGFRNLGIYLAHYNRSHPEKTRFEKLPSPCDEAIINSEINNGCRMSNGHFVVTTNINGAFELDSNLTIVRHYNTKNGIYENNVKAAFEDKNGNLWLPLYYGIAFVETNSNLFQYNRNDGIAGLVQSAAFFENKLFIATDKGVQYFDSLENKFVSYLQFNIQSWYLYTHANRLFIGTEKGLFVSEKGRIKQLSESKTNCILSDPNQMALLYAGTKTGIESYWIKENSIERITSYELDGEIRSMAFDSEKNLFFVSDAHTIYYLNFLKANSLDSIAPKDALPEQTFETYLFNFTGKLVMGTDSGIYALQKNKEGRFQCIKDPQLWPITSQSQVFRATQFGKGVICYQRYAGGEGNESVEKITYIQVNSLKQKVEGKAISHLGDIVPALITYDSLRNLAFICANEGLFILRKQKIENPKTYQLVLHSFLSKKDTIWSYLSNVSELRTSKSIIPYAKNDIIANFGFTSFETTNILFSYKLEGRDKEFSEWDEINSITLSNLFEGEYTLIVKAKTELEDKEYTLSIPFTISPPWYRSIVAYLVYFLIFLAIIFLAVKLNSKRLIEDNRKLEKTIEERTSTISHQKEEIEHKQKEILDSINYAQRIQRALLASEKLLDKNLPEYFVFFQPKDVVSGDFYWAAELKNKQFALVTADSTGHGVPGAIMSMLNISCLKEAVESEKLTSAKDILNHTRKKVIQTLANDGSESGGKDGMDCSLLCLDLNNKRFSYAAANNPVWVIRMNGSTKEKELIELSPDKMPVGKHDRDSVSFNEHVFELQKGDVIYTLTDGLPDQFGGPKGKKFMYKQLKELLLSISELSMIEQKQKLLEALENWRGYNEQVDDICLIGVKI